MKGRKGKMEREKGNEIKQGSIYGNKKKMCKKKGEFLACYLEGKDFLSPGPNRKFHIHR